MSDPNYNDLKLIYFGHNRKDIASIKRIESFISIGLNVTSYTFRRDGEPKNLGPAWDNVDLGHIEHAKLFGRLKTLLKAIMQISRNKKKLSSAEIFYARNLDMALLAWLSIVLSNSKSTYLVYECLDIHESLTRNSIFAKLLRWVERRILNKSKLLIVSSPGFMQHYFIPYQNYHEPYYLLENKLYFHTLNIKRPIKLVQNNDSDKPIVIIWAGILRCQETLSLIKNLAQSMQGKVHIRLHGIISHFLIPDFMQQITNLKNISYKGPYTWPQGLEEVYKNADFVWAQELSWKEHNSDWLIPNRVYEASYFGVPSIAVTGTQTANFIQQRKLGYVVDRDNLKHLGEFLLNIDKTDLDNKKYSLLMRPEHEFVADERDAQKLIDNIVK